MLFHMHVHKYPTQPTNQPRVQANWVLVTRLYMPGMFWLATDGYPLPRDPEAHKFGTWHVQFSLVEGAR